MHVHHNDSAIIGELIAAKDMSKGDGTWNAQPVSNGLFEYK